MSQRNSELLANKIIEALYNEFEEKHLSGRLVETIRTYQTEDSTLIVIPARIYNFYKFFKEGVDVDRGTGSYAEKLNRYGSSFPLYNKQGKRIGFANPRNHIGYVDRCIREGIKQFKAENNLKFRRVKGEDNGLK